MSINTKQLNIKSCHSDFQDKTELGSLAVLNDDEAEAAKTIEIVYPGYMLNMIFQELQGPITMAETNIME